MTAQMIGEHDGKGQKSMILNVPAYKGKEPYAFISYAHKDSAKAEKVMKSMGEYGLRMWYDDGIEGVSVWDDRIAEAIEGSSYFIALMSRSYIASKNCRDEIKYANDLDKMVLLIYIDDVKLTGGLAMRLNRNQALFYRSDEEIARFGDKLSECVGIQLCMDNDNAENAADSEAIEEEPTISTYVDGFNKRVDGWLRNVRDKSIGKIRSQRVKNFLIRVAEIEDRHSARAERAAECMRDGLRAFGRGMLLYFKDSFKVGGKTRISSCIFVAKNIWLPLLAGIALFLLFAVVSPGWLEIETLYADSDTQYSIYCAVMCIGTSLLWGATNGVMLHERRINKTKGAEFSGYFGMMGLMTIGFIFLVMTCTVYFGNTELTSEEIDALLTRKPDVIVFVTMLFMHLIYDVWFIMRADRER